MENLSSLVEPLRPKPQKGPTEWKKSKTLQGPKRAIRLCLLGIILPGLFISVPLYLKHRVYDYQVYPIGMSDMRLIDNRVSTTWCQRQLVKSNATFNAFLMPESPHVAHERTPVAMTRHLKLSDDMKEYWGFYLLKGSTVTVSTCARWPGASLILIRGHRHLHECAYIGDDSSEELEELMEIVAEGNVIQVPKTDVSDESPSNRVDLLTKHRAEVTFHDPNNDPKLKDNAHKYVFQTKDSETEEEINTKQMKELLTALSFKANLAQRSKDQITEAEKKERYQKLKNELLELQKTNKQHHKHMKRIPTFGGSEDEELIHFEDTIDNSTSSAKNISSKELLDGVLKKLKLLGLKGERVLEMLQNVDKSKIGLENVNVNDTSTSSSRLDVNTTQSSDTQKLNETTSAALLRKKRELILQTVLGHELTSAEEEKENMAIEEGYVPDGIADHHQRLNQTTLNDRSNSEFWSSFSSSEEALLNCAGLILSLPLNPHKMCEHHRSDGDFDKASLANKITYSVPTNGYYFFVFNSENEVQENYIRVHFNLQKTMYNVSNAVSRCSNATNQCDFNLDFFSNEKVVFELPVKMNETRWNEEFIVVSECEPRTAIYLLCVLSVPLLILLFAFQ